MAMSPDGQQIVSCSADETIKFWSIFEHNQIPHIKKSMEFVQIR